MTESNGGHSMLELKLSENSTEEDGLSQQEKNTVSEDNMLSQVSGLDTTLKGSNGMLVLIETSETMDPSASKQLAEETLTYHTFTGRTASTIHLKDGGLIKDQTGTLDNHMVTQEDSKSDQECLEEEPSHSMSILVHTNIDLESKTSNHSTKTNGGSLITEPSLSDLTREETMLSVFNSTTSIDKPMLLS